MMMKDLFLNALEQNKEVIFRICTAYSASHEDAKDLMQEVLIHVWQSLPSFQNKASISTWIYRITVNVCLRAQQKEEKRKQLFRAADRIKLENIQFAEPANRSYEGLYRCIRTLNDVEKAVVLLYLEDLSYKDMAAITGLTENHIAVKIKRIKAKLFQCLKFQDDEQR